MSGAGRGAQHSLPRALATAAWGIFPPGWGCRSRITGKAYSDGPHSPETRHFLPLKFKSLILGEAPTLHGVTQQALGVRSVSLKLWDRSWSKLENSRNGGPALSP